MDTQGGVVFKPFSTSALVQLHSSGGCWDYSARDLVRHHTLLRSFEPTTLFALEYAWPLNDITFQLVRFLLCCKRCHGMCRGFAPDLVVAQQSFLFKLLPTPA
jgi:hypothetical protein